VSYDPSRRSKTQDRSEKYGIGKMGTKAVALRGEEIIIPQRTLESGLKVKESLAD
jgi:hypothetical protein